MAMTAPVLMVPEKIAMTAPVLSSSSSVMSFVLPFHFKSLAEVPSPTDKRVRVRQIPSRIVAVRGFSGWYSDAEAEQHREALRKQLVADELVRDGAALEWSVAQYHPPFTLGFLRKNEVWVELDEKHAKVKEMVAKARANAAATAAAK